MSIVYCFCRMTSIYINSLALADHFYKLYQILQLFLDLQKLISIQRKATTYKAMVDLIKFILHYFPSYLERARLS